MFVSECGKAGVGCSNQGSSPKTHMLRKCFLSDSEDERRGDNALVHRAHVGGRHSEFQELRGVPWDGSGL